MPSRNPPYVYEELIPWVRTVYFDSLTDSISRSLTYLHTTINWALTASTAAIGIIFAQQLINKSSGIIILILVAILITHFFSRSCKTYINVMRYSGIQKHIEHFIIKDQSRFEYERILKIIYELDVLWYCPIKPRTIIYKVSVEFGYLYVYLIIYTTIIYALSVTNTGNWAHILVIFGTIFCIFEIYVNLFRSPYLRTVRVDDLIENQR